MNVYFYFTLCCTLLQYHAIEKDYHTYREENWHWNINEVITLSLLPKFLFFILLSTYQFCPYLKRISWGPALVELLHSSSCLLGLTAQTEMRPASFARLLPASALPVKVPLHISIRFFITWHIANFLLNFKNQ